MIFVGELSLWVAALLALWCTVVSYAGAALRRSDLIASGERAIVATCGLVAIAAIALWVAIFTSDLSLRYVATYTAANLPTIYKISALWAGVPGALLFWSLLLSLGATIALWGHRGSAGFEPYATAALGGVLFVSLASAVLGANPFERLEWSLPDGRGMHPALQHLPVVLHAPMLLAGYVSATIAFALAAGAAIARREPPDWLAPVRRWTLAASSLVTAGVMLGMWRAYADPGWGAAWPWEPVRNASLLPWLSAAAFLHVAPLGERGDLPRGWIPFFPVVTFLLAMVAMTVGWRRDLASGAVGNPAGAGPPLAELAVVVLAALVLVAAGVRATFARRRLTPRPPARYAARVAHAGALVVVAALPAVAFRKEATATLAAAQSYETTDPFGRRWTFTNHGVSHVDALNREVTAVALEAVRDGRPVGILTSEIRQYVDARGVPIFDPWTEVGIRSSYLEDVYVTLTRVRDDETVEVRIAFNPLVLWIWHGGALMALGALLGIRTTAKGAGA